MTGPRQREKARRLRRQLVELVLAIVIGSRLIRVGIVAVPREISNPTGVVVGPVQRVLHLPREIPVHLSAKRHLERAPLQVSL